MAAVDGILTMTRLVELLVQQQHVSRRDHQAWVDKLSGSPTDEDLAALEGYMARLAARMEGVADKVDPDRLKARMAEESIAELADGDVMVTEVAQRAREVETLVKAARANPRGDLAPLVSKMGEVDRAFTRKAVIKPLGRP